MRFKHLAHVSWVLALMVLGASTALAGEAGEILSAGDLGLAQNLRWGMTIADAKLALPALTLVPDPGRFDPRLAFVGTSAIRYAGCDLNFTLRFFRDHLDHVRVQTQNGADCHSDIERDLTARYHDPNIPVACP